MSVDGDPLDVLLVEDNAGDATLVQHHIRNGSFPGVPEQTAVTHVESLSAALEAVCSSSFDIVLLDLGLPECKGVETLESFLPEVPDVPVVVLTGLDDKETAVEAIQHGAQDYLPKDDLTTDVLLRSIRYAIERKKQELALREQTEQMKFFNSILRHDVGNGMDVIRRNAQLLEDSADGEDAERAGTILSWSNDIIDLTGKIRRMLEAVAGEEDLSLSRVDLSGTLRARIDHVQSMEYEATIEAEIPDGLTVQADDMLPAVLGNLLSNAIEHNDADQPRVEVSVTEEVDSVTITFADNGPGIPDDEKEAIFGWGESRRSSSGFGLYFVETMVDSYGGSVDVADNDPRGAVFSVTLQKAAGIASV